MKTAMIVLASEQLWPNLSGLVHWHENEGGVDALFIYHTGDERRSEAPAGRLKRLCRAVYPEIEVILPEKPCGIVPSAVRAQIGSWRTGRGDEWRWVINATGGVKLMFEGAMAFCSEERCQVIYRELSGQWFELTRTTELGHVEAVEIEIDPGVTDDVEVDRLIEMQSDAPAGMRWNTARPRRLPVDRITETGISNDWNWEKAFRSAGIDPRGRQGGLLFEEYVAAALRLLDVTNCKINAELQGAVGQGAQAVSETDIVANAGGRLLMIDCKLREADQAGDTPLTDQISRAANLQRRMGGLSAACALVRPNREFSDLHRRYAESARLTVIDRGQAPSFFSALAKFVGRRNPDDLPPELADAQARLNRAHREGKLIFGRMSAAAQLDPKQAKQLEEDGFLNLMRAADATMAELEQDWFCHSWRGRWHLYWQPSAAVDSSDPPRAVLENMLRKELGRAWEIGAEPSKKGASCYASIMPRPGCKEPAAGIRRFLESRRGKTLLP